MGHLPASLPLTANLVATASTFPDPVQFRSQAECSGLELGSLHSHWLTRSWVTLLASKARAPASKGFEQQPGTAGWL